MLMPFDEHDQQALRILGFTIAVTAGGEFAKLEGEMKIYITRSGDDRLSLAIRLPRGGENTDSCAHAPCSEQDSHIPLDRRTFLQWLSRWWRGHDEREGTGVRKREPRRPLPREVVADERVAAGGIIP